MLNSYKALLSNLLGLSCVTFLLLIDSNPFIATYLFGVLSTYYFFQESRGFLNVIIAWNLGFLMIIGLDGILNYHAIFTKIGALPTQISVILINGSYFLINIFYIIFSLKYNVWNKVYAGENIKTGTLSFFSITVISILYIAYFYSMVPQAIDTFIYGRFFLLNSSQYSGLNNSPGVVQALLIHLNNYSSLILPALIYYCFNCSKKIKRSFGYAVLFSAPIFVTQLLLGTRYKLLLSGGTFIAMYIYYNNRNLKKFRYVLLALVIAFLAGSIISSIRGQGWNALLESENEINISFTHTEGTFGLMTMVTDYYLERDHEYGSSTGAIILFWIPRSVWPDKPTWMAYWFVRTYPKYDGPIGPDYSAPASYASTVYSDFGILGVFLQIIFLSLVFVMTDSRLKTYMDKYTLSKIFYYFLIPLAFFLPRQSSLTYSLFIGVGLILSGINLLSKTKISKE